MPTQFNTLCQETTLYEAWNAVKSKGSAGGVDGVTIEEFNKEKITHIKKLREDLIAGEWKPQPYLQIAIPKTKDPNEMRILGMAAVRDKIVQQAIRKIIEPRFERLFLPNNFAYRPGKGALRTIKYIVKQCGNKDYLYALRLDVDNYFDGIDHTILQQRLTAIGIEDELIRLIMLSVKMGRVQPSGVWTEPTKGIPQGAVLSPLLANLYLHSFDQFCVSKSLPYARYGDDSFILCKTQEQADEIKDKAQKYLSGKLKLSLNAPACSLISEGFDFLGVTIKGQKIFITEKKRDELEGRILGLFFSPEGLIPQSNKTWEGLRNYYAKLLPQQDLEFFDDALIRRITFAIENSDAFKSKTSLIATLSNIHFLSKRYNKDHKHHIDALVGIFLNCRSKEKQVSDEKTNRKIIQERKKEYRRIETETSGLLVNKPGTFIGLTSRGITASYKGKVIAQHHKDNLSQIIVTGQGVSMSSNLINLCLTNRIPIDFFDHQGTHLGSVISAKYIQNTLWAKQTGANALLKNTIALCIIEGKIKNQHALLKYFNKYHKNQYPGLQSKMEEMVKVADDFKAWKKLAKPTDDDFIQKLVGHEAQVAIRYWDYIRELFADDQVCFESREHKGASDLVNSLLNYGYAILYVRVWQALLAAKLNPFESLIHVRQEGKPTLVYDFVEIFRSQVVDRIVISLIQKGQELEVRNGLLTDQTRQLLVKSIMERLARYEKYQGEEIKMEQIILRQAKLLAKAFEGTSKFKPYVAKW
jgi:group II intron reverse transcriptase/maturase/CRISPR-associated endonuclease Cas1